MFVRNCIGTSFISLLSLCKIYDELMKLLNNFFNGNIRLWVSFWIIGLCYPFLVGFIFVFLHFTGILLIDSLEGTFYLMPSIFLILQIFVTVGVWRTSNKYQGN